MLGKQRAEGLRRIESALRAQILEPACPDRNMVYFLTQNDLGDGDGLDITDLAQAHHHARRHIKRSEEHTSELQSLMRISYAVFCLKKKQQSQREQPRPDQ